MCGRSRTDYVARGVGKSHTTEPFVGARSWPGSCGDISDDGIRPIQTTIERLIHTHTHTRTHTHRLPQLPAARTSRKIFTESYRILGPFQKRSTTASCSTSSKSLERVITTARAEIESQMSRRTNNACKAPRKHPSSTAGATRRVRRLAGSLRGRESSHNNTLENGIHVCRK